MASQANAQLLVSTTDSANVITFNAVQSGVWGASTLGTTSGYNPTPTTGSPFDSDAWAVRVGGSANYTLPAAGTNTTTAVGFGGTQTTGGVARGVNATGGFTSGLGLSNTMAGVTNNNALVFNPTGTGTDNATVFLRIQNTTGSTVTSWTFDYDAYYINVGSYATPVNFAFSTDGGTSFSSIVPALGFTTPGTGTVTTPTASDWTAVSIAATTISATVDNGDFLIIQFQLGQDIPVNNQPGNRIAIDNISVTAVPEPSAALLLALGGVGLVVFRRRHMVG